ncbi:MAG: hypothetical protein RLZZ387_5327 [Chloroflexota bacterium]
MSQNSSKPPSSKPASTPPRPSKVPRGRKASGGIRACRPDRERHESDPIIPIYPGACSLCQTLLYLTLPDVDPPLVNQVWELPSIRPQGTHTVCCPTCEQPSPTGPAERALRPAVIWRMQSEDGNDYVERVLSVVMTWHQQGRNVWEILTDAVAAAWASQPAPSLLPPPERLHRCEFYAPQHPDTVGGEMHGSS